MGRRLILDTSILIAYGREALDRSMFDDDELAVAALTVAEFRIGIELADTARRAASRSRSLALLTSFVTYSTTPKRQQCITRNSSRALGAAGRTAARTT